MITLILKAEASHYDRYSCIGYQHISIGFYPLSRPFWNLEYSENIHDQFSKNIQL